MAAILELEQVSQTFVSRSSVAEKILSHLHLASPPKSVRALQQISCKINEGESIGLAGESGCGKSTFARVISQLLPDYQGQMLFRGQDVRSMTRAQRLAMQLQLQMVFQNPFASLNPHKRVKDIILEAPRFHGLLDGSNEDQELKRLLEQVGLPFNVASRLPHQFSGGQRQRIAIARALAVKPKVLIADEAVAALDVSIQAQIVNLLATLKDQLKLTLIFISHDLGVIRHLCDRIIVMYLGRIVEQADCQSFFANPQHPYSRALLEAIPLLADGKVEYHPLQGEIPSPLSPPSGCAFNPRCPFAMPICQQQTPQLTAGKDGSVACHKVAMTVG